MKRRLPSFLAGMMATALLGSLTLSAFAAGRMTIEVDPVSIQVNGAAFQPKDVNGNEVPVFALDGTTYAPVRALAEAYGLEVGYDAATNTATVSDPAKAGRPVAGTRVLEDGYVIPEGTLMTASANSGKKFIYNMENLYVVAGYDVVYLDEYEFQLSKTATAAPAAGDVYLSLEDVAKIYGPDFHLTEREGGVEIAHAGLTATVTAGSAQVVANNGTFTMDNPVQELDGVLCVPVLQFMERAFGKYLSSQETTCWDASASAAGKYEFDKYENVAITVHALSNSPGGSISDTGNVYTSVVSALKNKLRGAKEYGIVYKAFYDERVDKCITTQLYIPTSLYFDPDKEMKCIILFPGANGNANSYSSADRDINMSQTFQLYAEEYGYVLATVESYINSGQYGDPTGPIGRFPVTNPENPENPWNKDEGWLTDIKLSGEVVIDTLDYTLGLVPSIDPDQVYAVGVSMGSMGAFSMGINYNDRFAGLVGTAGLTEIDHWDVSKIGDTPFLFIGGTEDTNGVDFMLYGIERLQKELTNFTYILTGGAVHGAEWKPYAEDIFRWLEDIGA